MKQRKPNLLAARVHPWQLFKFKRYCEWRKIKPSDGIQEALSYLYYESRIPKKVCDSWLREYHEANLD